jgi:hypothetical protein
MRLRAREAFDQQDAGRLQQLHPECRGGQQAYGGVGGAQVEREGGEDHAAGHGGHRVRKAGLAHQMLEAALALGVAQLKRRGKKHRQGQGLKAARIFGGMVSTGGAAMRSRWTHTLQRSRNPCRQVC